MMGDRIPLRDCGPYDDRIPLREVPLPPAGPASDEPVIVHIEIHLTIGVLIARSRAAR